jgi:hypothetical protein
VTIIPIVVFWVHAVKEMPFIVTGGIAILLIILNMESSSLEELWKNFRTTAVPMMFVVLMGRVL